VGEAATGSDGQILGDPRLQCGDVLVLDPAEPVIREVPCRLTGRAGTSQGKNGSVLQPEVVRALVERALGQVEGHQQLAAPLGLEHRLMRGVRPHRLTLDTRLSRDNERRPI
jgi:hypothetical protein